LDELLKHGSKDIRDNMMNIVTSNLMFF